MTTLRSIADAIEFARVTVRRSRAVRDLLCLIAFTGAVFAGSACFDLNEQLMSWMLRHGDVYQLDEVPLALVGAALGFGWYSIRRWREYKQELRRRFALEQRLRVAAEEAELANRAKSEFLANMSHELRTPLNGILGFSEALAAGYFGTLTPRQREYIRDIHMSGEHLLRIINDILDMAKIDAGRLTLSEEAVDIGAVIESCLRLVRHRADAAGVTLTVEPVLPAPQLRADELRMKQVVLNLLSNAVKFTPAKGRVTIRMSYHDDGSFLLTIADTGIGMSESDIATALTPFAQVENFLTRKHEGTGLGLPIVNALVGLHGGRLLIRSTPDAGTVVTVVLPPDRVIREAFRATKAFQAA